MGSSADDPVTKTTVYLDAGDYQRLKALARAEGRTAAELVREAVAEYARRRSKVLRPRSLGAGRSRKGDLSERAEELLDGLGRGE
jgi:predicted transcriptional regulator